MAVRAGGKGTERDRFCLPQVEVSQPEPGSHFPYPGKSLFLTIHLLLVPDDVRFKPPFPQYRLIRSATATALLPATREPESVLNSVMNPSET